VPTEEEEEEEEEEKRKRRRRRRRKACSTMREKRNICSILVGKSERNLRLIDLSVDRMITLKLILRKYAEIVWSVQLA